MDRWTTDLLPFAERSQVLYHVKMQSHFQMGSGLGILMLFTWGSRTKEMTHINTRESLRFRHTQYMFFQSTDLLRGLISNNYTNSSHFTWQLTEIFFLHELYMNLPHVWSWSRTYFCVF